MLVVYQFVSTTYFSWEIYFWLHQEEELHGDSSVNTNDVYKSLSICRRIGLPMCSSL